MTVKHSIQVRRRAFSIWQKLGFNPWKKPRKARKRSSRDFYKGAFDSIPFLNEDAKRTFTHLLLRPGYMIRDYICGQHERYLAPLTALIVFYAFFALVSSVLEPIQHRQSDRFQNAVEALSEKEIEVNFNGEEPSERGQLLFKNTLHLLYTGYVYFTLDKHPEAVKTQRDSALAALESTLRSQGIPLFIGEFFVLWLAMGLALRKYRLGMSAIAVTAAYILCQFSFFMLFAVLFTLGESKSIGVSLMLLLITTDLHQLLDVGWKKSLGLTIRTGVFYVLILGLVFLLISVLVVSLAWFNGRQAL